MASKSHAAHASDNDTSLRKQSPPQVGRNVIRATLKHGDKMAATACLAALAALTVSVLKLELGTLVAPGPALWPLIVLSVGILACATLFITGRERPILARERPPRRLYIYATCILLYPALYTMAGYFIATALIVFILMRFASQMRWLTTAVSCVAITAATYLIFAVGLDIPFNM